MKATERVASECKAFTLIELLVVIAILAVLATNGSFTIDDARVYAA